MSSAPTLTLSGYAVQAYSAGYGSHGDIDLQPEAFENRLRSVLEKHLGRYVSVPDALNFLRALHSTDLYLTEACSQPSNRAWKRFVTCYQRYINSVARFVSPSSDMARELASDLIADLFMPDRSGHSRIASFDGQHSLATWLRVLVANRATNLRLLKWNTLERIDCLPDVPDVAAVARIEAAMRAGKYEAILADCFKLACEGLTVRERFIVLLRYDEGLRIVEIAKHLEVHPTGITRQLQRARLKLQKKIISVLTVKYRLGPAAIKECLADIVENPAHSLLVFLKASAHHHNCQRAPKCS